MLTAIGFYLLAGLAGLAGVVLVASRNLFHAVLGLAVASLAVAGLLLALNQEFTALVLILVYVGAVVVMGVFAVMLTGNFSKPTLPPSNELKVLGALTALATAGLLGGVILLQPRTAAVLGEPLSVKALGALLMGEYVLPFELVSVLLLASLVGAIVLARGQEE